MHIFVEHHLNHLKVQSVLLLNKKKNHYFHFGIHLHILNILEVEVIFLYGFEAIQSQVIVGLGEGTLTLLTEQHR